MVFGHNYGAFRVGVSSTSVDAPPFTTIFFAGLFDGNVRTRVDPTSAERVLTSPANRVPEDELDLRVMIGGVSLVARAEVENFPISAAVTDPRAKDFTALEAGNEDLLFRGRIAERLPMHFLFSELDELVDAARDRVAEGYTPRAASAHPPRAR